MHLHLRDRDDAHSLMLLWAAVTGVYFTAVLYRLLVLHYSVGLPTYAGLSAIGAVWFALVGAVNPHETLKIAVIVSLLTSLGLNAALITRTIISNRGIPVARSVFSALLLIGLFDAIRQFSRRSVHRVRE